MPGFTCRPRGAGGNSTTAWLGLDPGAETTIDCEGESFTLPAGCKRLEAAPRLAGDIYIELSGADFLVSGTGKTTPEAPRAALARLAAREKAL